MSEQINNIPPAATGTPSSTNSLIQMSQGIIPKKPGTTAPTADLSNNSLVKMSRDTSALENAPKTTPDSTDSKIQGRISTMEEIAAFNQIDRQGYTLDEKGNKVSNDKLDKASWIDQLGGNSTITDKDGVARLARITTGYASDDKKNKDGDQDSKDSRNFLESALGVIPGANKLIGGAYNQTGFKTYVDPDTGESTLVPFTPTNDKDLHNVVSAYGPKTFSKSFNRTFVDGMGGFVGEFGKDVVNLAQMGKDLIDPNQNSLLDKISNHLNEQNILNRNSEYMNSGAFDSLSGFSGSIGSGISSLFSFGAFGKGASLAAKASMLFKSTEAVDMAGRLGGAFLLSAGGLFNESRESGLDPQSSAAMAMSLGAIDAVLQEAIGPNTLAKYMIKGGGKEINNIVLDEVKQFGSEVTEKTLNAATPNILKRITAAVLKNPVFEIPVAGPGLEQGLQMGIQSMVNSTGKMLYNHMNEGNPDKSEGHGLYNNITQSDFFSSAFNEAASAGILGAIMGVPMTFSKHNEAKDILPYIAAGKTKDILKSVDWMRSDGTLTTEQAQAYSERVNQLDDIFNKNKKAFDNLSKIDKNDHTAADLIGHIDNELRTKNQLKKEQDILSKINSRPKEDNESDVIREKEIKDQQIQVDIQEEKLRNIKEKIKDSIPDENGKVPIVEKTRIAKEIIDHIVDKHLKPTKTQEEYATDFANLFVSNTPSVNEPLKSLISTLYENHNSNFNDDHKTIVNDLIEPHKGKQPGNLKQLFKLYIENEKTKEAANSESFKDRVSSLSEDGLNEVLNNEQTTKKDKAYAQDEFNRRKNKEKEDTDKSDKSLVDENEKNKVKENRPLGVFDKENPKSEENVRAVLDTDSTDELNNRLHGTNYNDIQDIISHPVMEENDRNLNVHKPFLLDLLRKNKIEKDASEKKQEDLKKQIEDLKQKLEDDKVLTDDEIERLKQAAEDEREFNSPFDKVNVEGDPIIDSEGNLIDETVKQNNKDTNSDNVDFDKVLKDQKNENGRTSAHQITFKALEQDKSKSGHNSDMYDADGKIIQVPHNNKLESNLFYNKGEVVTIRPIKFGERGTEYHNGDETKFKKVESDPATIDLGVYDKNGEFLGHYPTMGNVAKTKNITEEIIKQALNIRQQLHANKEKSNNVLYTKIVNKTGGWLNINKKGTRQAIFTALGNGTRLANQVTLAIGANQAFMKNRGKPLLRESVNQKVSEGYVYAQVPRADGSFVCVPLTVSQVGAENAIGIRKLLLALFSNTSKLKESLLRDNVLPNTNKNNAFEVMAAIKQLVYIQANDKEDAPNGNHIFRIDTKYPNPNITEKSKRDLITVIKLGETENDVFLLSDIFPNKDGKGKRQDEFDNIIANRYRSVNLDDLNKNEKFRSFTHENNHVIGTDYDNYAKYLNDESVLTTDIQGFPVEEGSNDYTFTSQPVVELDGNFLKTDPNAKLDKSKKPKVLDDIAEPSLVGKSIEESLLDDFGLTEEEILQSQKSNPVKSIGQLAETTKALSFDNPENKNLKDSLFVNNDVFSNLNQNSVINGLSSIIHDLAMNKGVTSKTELLEAVKKNIESKYNSASKFERLADFASKYKDILDNYDRFEKFALAKLAGMGIEFKKEKIVYEQNPIPKEEDIENPERTGDELETASQTHGKTNFEENYQFSESALNKASAKIRALLSFIPETYFTKDSDGNNKSNLVKNAFALNEYVPIHKVWGKLMNATFDLTPGEIMTSLENLARKDPMYNQILAALNAHSDDSTIKEFQVLLSKQQARFVTIIMGKPGEDGTRALKVIDTNRKNAHEIVTSDWEEGMRTNKNLVSYNDKTKDLTINTVEGKRIYDDYKKAIKEINVKKDPRAALEVMKATMKELGMEVSDNFVAHILDNGVKFQGRRLKVESLLEKQFEFILQRVAGLKSETLDPDTDPFAKNNPFFTEQALLKTLADVEAAANTQLYETSFVGGDGKARYSYVNNSYLSNFMKKFAQMDENGLNKIVESLKTIPYSAKSMWLANWDSMGDNFGLSYLDTLGSQQSSAKNKLIKNMSEAEKELTRASLYQNAGKEAASKYLIPIPGDKTLIPIITAMRIKTSLMETKESSDRLINKDSTAMDHLYNLFLSEHDRIQKVQETNAASKKSKNTDGLIAGYHYLIDKATGEKIPGMGEKFFTYKFLNDDEEIFDKNGKIREAPEDHVREKIQEFIDKSIKDQEENWKRLKLIDTVHPEKSIIFDKNYHKNKNKDQIANFAAEYTINQFLFTANYTQVIGGDPALHGKSDIKETEINYNKRMVKDLAPGLDPMFGNKQTFNTMFLKDISGPSQYLDTYMKILSKTIGEKAVNAAYKNMNTTDAQEYTTLQEHMDVMEGLGQMTPEIRAAADRLIKGGDNPQDISAILGPMKPVYVGDKYDQEMGVARKYYIKTSSFPLIPSLVKGTPLDLLRVYMENYKDSNGEPIHRAVYESGVKLGLEDSSTPMSEGKSLDMNPDFKGSKVYTLDRDGFRIQQDIPYHGPSYATEGSQVRYLINANLEPGTSIYSMGKERPVEEATRMFEQLHAQQSELKWRELSKTFGIEKSDNENTEYKINDVPAFQKVLLDEATKRGYPVNEIIGLNLVENGKTGESSFKIPLGFNSASSKFEAIMNSMFNNSVLSQKLPGGMYVQGSSAGFRFTDQLSQSFRNGIVHIDPSTKNEALKYFEPKDGKNGVAEIYIPSHIKDKDGNTVDLSGMDLNKIDPELLHFFGYRIPTQGLNSMMTFKVKGFLPGYMGDLVIVPSEIVAQMGSDFDVDKLFMHHFNYTHDPESDTYTKTRSLSEKELNNISSVKDPKRIENSILEHYMDRFHYANDKTSAQILEPNGYGKLDDLNKEIAKIYNTEDLNFFLPTAQNDLHSKNIDGLAGKGIFSLYSAFMQVAQSKNLKLGKDICFNVDGIDHARSGFEITNVHGGLSTSVIAFLQSAAVDNAKLQYLSGLNINPHTMSVAGLIAANGYDESHIAYFLSQPVLRDYTKIMSGLYDLTDSTFDPEKLSKAVNTLVEPYIIKSGKSYGDNFFTRVNANQLSPKRVWSLDEMKEEMKNPTPEGQLDMMINFLRMKVQARAVDQVIGAVGITKGIGSTYVELESKLTEIGTARNADPNNDLGTGPQNPLRQVKGVDKLFDDKNSILGKSSDLATKFYSAISRFFPYSNEGYSKMKDYLIEQSNTDNVLKVDYLKELYTQMNSFILSDTNLIDHENITDMRRRLFYDTPENKSLATRVKEELLITPKNGLLRRLKPKTATNKEDPNQITAMNIPSALKSDNVNEALSWFFTMHEDPRTKPLAEDLIKYFLTTGGSFNPTSIARFIPLDLLESYDYSEKLRAKNEESSKDPEFFSKFQTQYFQHNPEKAYTISKLELAKPSVKLKGNSLDIASSNNSLSFIKRTDGEVETKQFPSYFSIYDRKTKSTQLFGLKTIDPVTQGHHYERVGLLGQPNFTEYDFNAPDIAKSSISKNRSMDNTTGEIKDGLAMADTGNKNAKFEKDETRIEDLRENFKINTSEEGTNVRESLATIANNDHVPAWLQKVAGEIKEIVNENMMLKESSALDANGWYHNNEIHINLNKISQDTDGQKSKLTGETLVHETLHAITEDFLSRPDLLKGKQLEAYNRIKILFNKYVREASSTDLSNSQNKINYDRYNVILDKINKGITLKTPEINHFNKYNNLFYPLSSMSEFIAGLSNPQFASKLRSGTRNVNYWSKVFENTMTFLGLNFKNDWQALFHSVLAFHDRESGYEFGWNNANKIVKTDTPEEKGVSPPDEEAPKGFGGVTSDPEDFKDPNISNEPQYSLGKKLDTPEDAKTKILKAYNGNNQGYMPKEVVPDLVRQEIKKYNDQVGYEALSLKMAKSDSLYIVKNNNIKFSVGKINEEQKETFNHAKSSEILINKYKNDNEKLQKRLLTTDNKDRVWGIIGFNKKRIAELTESTRLTELVDIAKKQIDQSYATVQNGVLDSHTLDDIESIVNVYKDVNKEFKDNPFTTDVKGTEYNQKIKTINDKIASIEDSIRAKRHANMEFDAKLTLDLGPNTNLWNIVRGVQTDVGLIESQVLTGSRSSSKLIQLAANFIEHCKQCVTEELGKFNHTIDPMFEQFLKENKDYEQMLQHDSKGKRTNNLVSEYSHDYYVERAKAKEAGKLYEFIRDNSDTVLTTAGKLLYEKELARARANHREWDQPDTLDHAQYMAWVKASDPEAYIASIKNGDKPEQTRNVFNYIIQTPKAKWRDGEYDKLMSLGKDHNTVKLFKLIEAEFKHNNNKFSNNLSPNHIPEVSKDLMAYIVKGDIIGAFNGIYHGTLDSLTSRIDPIEPTHSNGPDDTIPVYMMTDVLKSNKSFDLKTVLVKLKSQDLTIQHKQNIAPHLRYLRQELARAKSYVMDNAGNQAMSIDEGGVYHPRINDTNGNPNAINQLKFMSDSFLYDKAINHKGLVGAPTADSNNQYSHATEDGLAPNARNWMGKKGDEYYTLTKVSDALNGLSRSTNLIFNIPAAINNLTFGIITNFNFATGQKEFNTNQCFHALGIMMNSLAVGTPEATRIKLFCEHFNIENMLNDVRFNKISGRNVENPFSKWNPYFMSQKGEYFIQNHLAIAMALNTKVGDTNVWDGYQVHDGHLVWQPKDKSIPDPFADPIDKKAFMKSVKNTIFKNHGNYEEPIQFKKEWLGRLMMTYKTWMPELINSRFGAKTENLDGTIDKGRFRSLWDGGLTKGADGNKSFPNIFKNLIEVYTKDPTLSHISALDRTNIRRSMSDLMLTVGMLSMGLALRASIVGDKDKDTKAKLIFMMNILNRNAQDMSFTFSPNSLTQLSSNMVPAITTLKNIFDLVPAAANMIVGNSDTYTNGKYKGDSKFVRKLVKTIPILNAEQKVQNEMVQKYN